MKAYCKALGIEPQPLEGKGYFQNMGDYGKTLATKRSPTKNPSPKEIQDAVNELLKANETTGKPWKKKDNTH